LPIFENSLTDVKFRDTLRHSDIRVEEALNLFKYLDDGSGFIDKNDLLLGLFRLRRGTGFLDILNVLTSLADVKKMLHPRG